MREGVVLSRGNNLLIDLARILMGRKVERFSFHRPENEPDFSLENAGLYLHVPFCKTLCKFCPYYKVKYEKVLARSFLKGLKQEIIEASQKRRIDNVTSVYYGGGSPGIMSGDLADINTVIRDHFAFNGDFAVELHPDNLTPRHLNDIVEAGFTMISVGVQSFEPPLLETLGRNDTTGPYERLQKLKTYPFKTIDIDLIFGIPGQTESSLKRDFQKAVELGATQISTYPFIAFSYLKNTQKPLGRAAKKRHLKALLQFSEECGFERTSVWTFAKKGTKRYSSVTRDFFVGFGPSATTLTRDAFYINTFSVKEYVRKTLKKESPVALQMDFTARTRMLYWFFWSCYEMRLDKDAFYSIFQRELKEVFSFWLFAGKLFGYLTETKAAYLLTERGALVYHEIEQRLTDAYIDKTWKNCYNEPWPSKLRI